MQDLLEDLEN